MFNSKINQLRESTFRQRPSLLKSSGYKGRVASVLLGAEQPSSSVDLNAALKDYLLSLPPCPFHHEPIRFLCLSPTCSSSTYALCGHPHCRTLHSDPSSELIELDSFNEFMSSNCSSLLLLARRTEGYLSEFRQRLLVELDRLIARSKYIFENVYMGEVPRLIRQGKHRELTSQRLFEFVKHESFENNLQQRIQMEGLRNEVTTRMAQFQTNFQHLISGKDFQGLGLGDIVKSTEGDSPFSMLGRMDIHQFQSRILESKEDFQEVCKMLKENRAPAFATITTIFRASEKHFLAEAFHRAVDGKGPLLILVKTTLGKRFGAFLNCRIDQREEWIPDATGLSFIFSLDRNETYRLKPQANSRLKAVFGGPQGPQVGSGCDLYILDQCHLRRGSGANLGGSYRLPGYLEHGSAKARAHLASEENFLVEEYEAFLME